MAESDSESIDMVIDVEAADFKERCEKAKVPADLPLRFAELWLKFSEAPFPVCEFNPGTLDVPQGFYLRAKPQPGVPNGRRAPAAAGGAVR
jgi:hypothetical protein